VHLRTFDGGTGNGYQVGFKQRAGRARLVKRYRVEGQCEPQLGWRFIAESLCRRPGQRVPLEACVARPQERLGLEQGKWAQDELKRSLEQLAPE
jgi:hypothetical protein